MPTTTEIDVNVGTLENVEKVLQEASTPVTRYYILKGLARRGRGTTAPRLEVALDYLLAHNLAIEGEKGVQWVHSDSPSLRRAVATGRRV